MKGKKILAFSLTVAMLAGGAMSVSAAGVSDVFSAGYYADKYADLKTAFGTDANALLQHFMTSGAKEGRVMSPILDVVAYRNAYADLDAAYGDNWDAYVDHYLTYGIKEKRTTGVLFDLADYAAKNADVKAAYGDDYAAIAQHYVTFGMKEGRPGGAIVKAAPAAAAPSAASNSGSTTTTPPASTAKPDEKPAEPVVTYTHEHAKGSTLDSDGNELGFLAPTCTEKGYQEWRCNAPLQRNVYNPATGAWLGVEFVVIDGKQVTCDVIWREELLPAHVKPESEDNYYDVHPTCATWGKTAYTCTRCGKQIEEELSPLEPVYEVVKTVASLNCKVAGYELQRCVNCQGKVHKDVQKPLPVLPHKLSDDKENINVTKAPDCMTLGSAYGYCSVCGEKVEVVLPFGDHDWALGVAAYANSYLQTHANEGGARTHVKYTVDYCKKCKLIKGVDLDLSLDTTTTYTMVPCEDNDHDGACDECKLGMKRNPTQQIKFYNINDTWIGNVQ